MQGWKDGLGRGFAARLVGAVHLRASLQEQRHSAQVPA
jgi:hypothetical protein